MPTYKASCHCGGIRYEFDSEITFAEVCNCSICTRNGYLHRYTPPDRFRLLSPQENVATYLFGTGRAKNHFCPTCGISPFRRARSDPNQVDINLRCVEALDLSAIPVRHFNGQHWEQGLADRNE